MLPLEWFYQAQDRISSHIIETPLVYEPELDVFFKWENHQITGSFKARGALNKILALQNWEMQQGIVAASAGNHGQGVALAASKVGARAIIFASEHAVAAKVAAMRQLGAQVHLVEGGYAEAEQAGLDYARESGAIWVSPYNDAQVIAGQGTIALEILRQNPALDQVAWLIPVGGGGLISGTAVVLATLASNAQAIGIQSVASPFFHAIFHTGSEQGVTEYPSLADGLSGPVEALSVTIPIIQRYVKDIVLVTESEIAAAISYAWIHYQERIEGSAAVALAAVLTGQITTRPIVILITGGNIQDEVFTQILNSPNY
jgi:threonine dehydratase